MLGVRGAEAGRGYPLASDRPREGRCRSALGSGASLGLGPGMPPGLSMSLGMRTPLGTRIGLSLALVLFSTYEIR